MCGCSWLGRVVNGEQQLGVALCFTICVTELAEASCATLERQVQAEAEENVQAVAVVIVNIFASLPPFTASHTQRFQVRAVTGGYFVAICLVFLGSLVGLKLPGLFSGGESGCPCVVWCVLRRGGAESHHGHGITSWSRCNGGCVDSWPTVVQCHKFSALLPSTTLSSPTRCCCPCLLSSPPTQALLPLASPWLLLALLRPTCCWTWTG